MADVSVGCERECGVSVGLVWGECGMNVGRVWGECGGECGVSVVMSVG